MYSVVIVGALLKLCVRSCSTCSGEVFTCRHCHNEAKQQMEKVGFFLFYFVSVVAEYLLLITIIM